MKLKINHIVILVLIGIVLYLKGCESGTPIEPKVITKVEVRYDTIETIKETYVPKWRTKIITEIDTFQAPIDTLNVLRDYYAKHYYQDTIDLDSLGLVVINDTITQNKIASRSINSSINVPITTIYRDTYLNPRELYWGVGLSGRASGLNYIGGELLYKGRNSQAFGAGVGVNQQLQPVLTFRYFRKIGK